MSVVISKSLHCSFRHIYRSNWNIVTKLYRGPFLCIVLIFLLSINVRGWGTSGVNHKLIFELNPRNHSSHLDIMETAMLLAVMWVVSLLLFLFADFLNFPAFYSHFILMICYLVFFLNPTKTLKYGARQWMLRVILRCILAPLPFVVFADFWVADQFNSLAPALADFEYTVCFYRNNRTTLNNDWDLAIDPGICNEGGNWIRTLLITFPAFVR